VNDTTTNGDEIVYRCGVCPPGDEYESGARADVVRHITMKADQYHDERNGNERGVINETTRAEIETEEANRRCDHDGEERTVVESGNAKYDGPAGGIDATMQNIAERPVKSTRQEGEVVTDVEAEPKVAVLLTPDDWARVLGPEGPDHEQRAEIVRQLSSVDGGDA